MEVVQLIVVKNNNKIQIITLDMDDTYKQMAGDEILEIILSVKGSIAIELLKNKYKMLYVEIV
jgi:hypothetical protein